MHGSLSTRLRIAAKALGGLISDRSATEAYGLLAGLYPATGPLPERGTLELLEGYNSMPWLRAVAYRVAHAVATVPWVLYRPTGGQQEKIIQRAYRRAERHVLLKQAVDAERLQPLENHIFLDALADANDWMVGPSLLFITQVHLDLPGEAFWIKERNGFGAPVGFWPIPPHWIKETPTVKHRAFHASWSAWQGDIPDTEIVWFSEPNPANPYGRGSGIGRALADELETDEYAARHEKMTLLNRARPDLVIWPEETKFDSGAIDEVAARRLSEKWRAEHQGFWRAALPFFATRKLGIQQIGQSFKDLGLKEIRDQERDIIIQVWGLPPEQLGIIENSNRATIDASDYLMKRNIVEPRLDLLRAYMQERIIPEYDERIVIDYVSPVQEDKEHHLKVAAVAPYAMTVDEWRAMMGHEPLEGGKGEVHMVPSTLTPKMDISEEPPPPISPFANPAGPQAVPPIPAQRTLKHVEWGDALQVCVEAGDIESANFVRKALADDPEDLPELSRRWGRKEPGVQRIIREQFNSLREQTDQDEIVAALQLVDAAAAARGVFAAVPLDAWAIEIEQATQAYMEDAFVLGARVGGEQAGLPSKAPHPVFNKVNPEAVVWAKKNTAKLIVQIQGTARDGVRQAVVQALELGWHPTKLAPIIRQSVGLTKQQTKSVLTFAKELASKGVPDDKLRQRVARYAEAQHRMRALTIARTELAEAASAGQQRLWDIAVEDGVLDHDRMEKVWIATFDELLEEVCEGLAQERVAIDETFSNGRQGPPAHPNCRCASGLVIGARAARPSPESWQVELKNVITDAFSGLRADLSAHFGQQPVIQVHVPTQPVHLHLPSKGARERVVDRNADGHITKITDRDVDWKYDPNQPRDDRGRFGEDGGGSPGAGSGGADADANLVDVDPDYVKGQ